MSVALFVPNANNFQLKSLIIKNSPELPNWNEHMRRLPNVDSLVVLQNEKVSLTSNINNLLRVARRELKIVSNGQIESLDLSYLDSNLTSISINQIASVNYARYHNQLLFNELHKLERLQFTKVRFVPPIVDPFFYGLPLVQIKIIGSFLMGIFSYVPVQCPPNSQQIEIDIRNNSLTNFNFAALFPNERPDCLYRLELDGNPFDANLLLDQIDILQSKYSNLHLNMGGMELN